MAGNQSDRWDMRLEGILMDAARKFSDSKFRLPIDFENRQNILKAEYARKVFKEILDFRRYEGRALVEIGTRRWYQDDSIEIITQKALQMSSNIFVAMLDIEIEELPGPSQDPNKNLEYVKQRVQCYILGRILAEFFTVAKEPRNSKTPKRLKQQLFDSVDVLVESSLDTQAPLARALRQRIQARAASQAGEQVTLKDRLLAPAKWLWDLIAK